MAKNKLSLTDLKAGLEKVSTPKQRVVPVQDEQEKLVLFNFQLTPELRNQLKIKATLEDTSIRELLLNAIYLCYPELNK